MCTAHPRGQATSSPCSHTSHTQAMAQTHGEHRQQPEGSQPLCCPPASATTGNGKKRRLGAASPLVLLLLLFASASAQGWWQPGPGVSWQVRDGLLDVPYCAQHYQNYLRRSTYSSDSCGRLLPA